jgi:hypothetical protein
LFYLPAAAIAAFHLFRLSSVMIAERAIEARDRDAVRGLRIFDRFLT